jgi:eukaryotic-like serine/threonine-protein kinase
VNSERWQQIEELFHEASELSPDARVRFLDGVCASDAELRNQVGALLDSLEESGDFIERSPVAKAVPAPAGSFIGRTIGYYETVSLLGTGGMGEIYLAKDSRLDRQIALKILPAQFTQDVTQVERFIREARAASTLNHPNIITVHEIGYDAGAHFIAMEFIAGETLREKINRGKIELKEALRIAAQIASALAAAHQAGIVHRDIKPENVMVRPDSLVKVLDFGLAKPLEIETSAANPGLPARVSLQTDPMFLMGTLAYLSPEHARREKVDHRTDLFSLGVVLYEMIEGERPFKGENAAVLLDAVLNNGPAASHQPAGVRRIVERALAKNRDGRYQTATEMLHDLTALEKEMSMPNRLSWRGKAMLAAAAILAAIAGWLIFRPAKAVSATLRNATFTRLTDHSGTKLFPALSPDGQTVVYASRTSGNWDLYLQKIGARDAINLTADSQSVELHPAFSPDGSRIAFHSSRGGDAICLMNADGSNVRRLADGGYNPAWSPDGREIVFATARIWDSEGRDKLSELYAVNIQSGARRRITGEDAVQPSWSPNRQRIAYWGQQKGGQRDIWTVAAEGGQPVAVTNDPAQDWNPIWSPDGRHLYFLSSRSGSMNLWRVPIDETSGRVTGAPEPETLPSASTQHLSFSANGKHLVYVRLNRQENMWQAGFDPVRGKLTGEPVRITQGARRHHFPELSPDGELIVAQSAGETQEDLFVINSDGTGFRQLTDDPAQNRMQRWSPDGQHIAFISDRGGKYDIWQVGRDGSDLRQLTAVRKGSAIAPVWSPDGMRLLYRVVDENCYLIETAKPFAEQPPVPLPGQPYRGFIPWSWSPDGKWLAGWQLWYEKEHGGVVVYSFETQAYEHLSQTGTTPIWLNDNRQLLTSNSSDLYLLDRLTKKPRLLYSIGPDQLGGFSLSRDNRKLYYSRISSETDLCLLTLR